MHAYIRTYVRTYIHAYIHTYMDACMHAYIRTYVRTYLHTYIRGWMHACIRTYVRTYIHTYIHTYTHTQTHVHKPLFGARMGDKSHLFPVWMVYGSCQYEKFRVPFILRKCCFKMVTNLHEQQRGCKVRRLVELTPEAKSPNAYERAQLAEAS